MQPGRGAAIRAARLGRVKPCSAGGELHVEKKIEVCGLNTESVSTTILFASVATLSQASATVRHKSRVKEIWTDLQESWQSNTFLDTLDARTPQNKLRK